MAALAEEGEVQEVRGCIYGAHEGGRTTLPCRDRRIRYLYRVSYNWRWQGSHRVAGTYLKAMVVSVCRKRAVDDVVGVELPWSCSATDRGWISRNH